jgi:DNA-binding MarR family transcriptional regulator
MLSKKDRAKVASYRLLMANVYELAAVSRRESEIVARQQNVTVTQWHTMSVLSDGNAASVPQIAARLGVTRQAVQRVADQLLHSGHVERVTNPKHDTSPLLRLTSAGDEVLSELWELSDAPRARMLADVDAAKLHEATSTLQAVISALKGSEPP